MVIRNSRSHFYVCNGEILKDMGDMQTLLKNIDNKTLSHHFNKEKNDFANWTKDILKDNGLAKKLRESKNKEEMLTAIKKKLDSKIQKSKKNLIYQIKEAISNE